MASPRPTRYVLRSQAMSPCRGSGPAVRVSRGIAENARQKSVKPQQPVPRITCPSSAGAAANRRVSGHAEHQRGVGDENFLGVDALAAAVGEGDVERGGRRGLVHLRTLSENPTGNHPGTLGSGPSSGPRSSLTALTSHTLGPGQPGQPGQSRRMGRWATRAGND